MQTRILKIVDAGRASFGCWAHIGPDGKPDLEVWEPSAVFSLPPKAEQGGQPQNQHPLSLAAHALRTSSVPVAFPTETVYGLGADATRSDSVRGIYAAKGRPADNPLIVHVSDLRMLRSLLDPAATCAKTEPIPAIYLPLIARFWPGPLTILLPNPTPTSPLAPEVTAGLPSFGARLPASPLARTLISLCRTPLAAPSANASTRPSSTQASHVHADLAGKIELILDGGDCDIGVESTVVDGMSCPPAVLRPGGVSLGEIREVRGWERTVRGYAHLVVGKEETPRAPGMKYKHYSPRARVVLLEGVASRDLTKREMVHDAVDKALAACVRGHKGGRLTVGIIRTTGRWPFRGDLVAKKHTLNPRVETTTASDEDQGQDTGRNVAREKREYILRKRLVLLSLKHENEQQNTSSREAVVLDIDLSPDVTRVAQGLFSALRELDAKGADVIIVEGVAGGSGDDDDEGNGLAAAIMNRLRKAASETIWK